MFLLNFNVYRKKRYEKFQAVSFCESTPGNLGFIRTLSSVYYSWLYKGHSLGQRLAVGLEVCQPPRSAGESTRVPSADRGCLAVPFCSCRPCPAQLHRGPSTLRVVVSSAPHFCQCVHSSGLCRTRLRDACTAWLQEDTMPSPGYATVFSFLGSGH